MLLRVATCDLKAHGSRHIELKLRYPVTDATSRAELDVYFFTPGQLQLDDVRYGVDAFLRDLRTNTRLSTPQMPLRSVLDPEYEQSPLVRIRELLRVSGTDISVHKVLYELRTMVNIYRVEMRTTRWLLRDELIGSTTPEEIRSVVSKLIEESQAVLREFRSQMLEFLDPHIPATLRAAADWADESMSLATEVERFKLHRLLERYHLEGAAEIMTPHLDTEREYRVSHRMSSWVDPEDDLHNEELLIRESTLKKWSQSVMYMSRERSKAVAGIGHILASIAAAAAMTFAIVATILTERLFANYTVPWALLIVVAYIFKDRLKSVLRGMLVKLLPGVVVDDGEVLHDPVSGRRAGRTRSVVRFESARHLPEEIRHARARDSEPFSSILPSEHIVHYRRRVKVRGGLLSKFHSRIESVTEILRLKLDSWLEEMDSPRNKLSYVKGEKIEIVEASRVYRTDVVVSLNHGGTKLVHRYRLILSREGLKRIEIIKGSQHRQETPD